MPEPYQITPKAAGFSDFPKEKIKNRQLTHEHLSSKAHWIHSISRGVLLFVKKAALHLQ